MNTRLKTPVLQLFVSDALGWVWTCIGRLPWYESWRVYRLFAVAYLTYKGRAKLEEEFGPDRRDECMALTLENRQFILDALDILGVALANHKHKWTEAERFAYEEARRVLVWPHVEFSAEEEEQ